ncbi:unnamed protein product [Closterium sp. NIES-53]
MSGTATAPPATADSATRSKWLIRDAAARLAIRNHLPLAKCAHIGQHRIARTLYDAVVACYSSPATAALGRLLLPYLFPELSAFATVKDLVSHLRASDARYSAAAPADAVAVGAARGTLRTPFFEGCSPSPLAPSYASAAAVDVLSTEDAGAASTSAKRRSSKGKGGRGGGGGSGSGGGDSSGGSGGSGGGGSGGSGGGSGGVGGGGGGSGGSGGSGGGGTGGGRSGVRCGGSGGGQRQQQERRSETQSPQQLREWLFQRGTSRGSDNCPHVICTGDRAGQACGRLHTQHRCFSRLDDALRAEFGDEVERPRWADLLRSGVAIFDLDFDAILSAMYALSVSAEGNCYRCVPPDPCIAAVALGASESGTPLVLHLLRPCTPSRWTQVPHAGRERYFLLVVDDYTRYTTVFPLRSKGQFVDVLIPWIRAVRLQLRERFCQDLPVLRLHSDRGGEFSSDLLRDFCRGEGILQSFTLSNSPQQNGISERRIGLVMEVACTSMIHAAAPHFLWLFAVQYAAHQLNLWPRVSLLETSPTLCLTGEVGDASVFRVWGSRAFVRNTSADKLSARAIPCVFLGFVPDAPGWQFYHPTSRRVFHCRTSHPLPPQVPAPSGVSQIDPLPGTAPVKVAVGSDATRGAASGGAASGGAASGGAEPGGAESEGAGSGGDELGGEEPWGAEPAGVEPEGTGDAGAGGAGVTAGAGGTGGTASASPRGARTGGTGAAGAGGVGGAGAGGAGVGGPDAGGAGAAGAGAVDPGAGVAGGTGRPRLYFLPLVQQVLGVPSSTSLPPPLLCPPPDQSWPPLQPASPLPAPSPYTEHAGSLTERRAPASRPFSPVRTACRIPRSRPPPDPGMHAMALRPSSVSLHVPLPAPPMSSLPSLPDPESDRARAARDKNTRDKKTRVHATKALQGGVTQAVVPQKSLV